MKKIYYRHFLRILLFYLLFFFVCRLIFLIVNNSHEPGFSWMDALPAFFHGMRMDLSVVTYTLLPSLILAFVYMFFPRQWINKVEFFYTHFILLLFCLIVTSNIVIFYYWKNLLNFRALTYLKDAAELASSFTIMQFVLIILALIAFISLAFYFFRKVAFRKFEIGNVSLGVKISHIILMTGMSVIMLRGGIQMLPMNESLVSVSENNFVNQATVNPAWHLANDIYRAGLFSGNPFETMDENEAAKIVYDLFLCDADSFPSILMTDKPNIVLIILESFSADVVEALGGEAGVSPSLSKLISDGVFFDNIYASGTRTDQGIVSLLNGWPATPYYSIMRSTDKTRNLPSLPILFGENGYATSFYYGGASNFSNLNSYCFNQKFNSITDQSNFPDDAIRGRWGVHDEVVFERQISDLNKSAQPFFSTLMTLSNHEPFDVPGPARFSGTSEADKFRNSAAYTDAKLGEYFEKAKSQPWYKNTLFITVADHGHSLPLNKNVYYPESHRIPFLFYGEVIKPEFKGSVVSKLGGHHDLAGTLLPQMKMPESKNFRWSKNLLNPTVKQFAYYQIDHLLGWIDPKYWFGYSYNRKKFIARSYNTPDDHLEEMKLEGQAFVQELYEEYRRY